MFKKMITFLSEHGIHTMVTGFVVAVIGLLVYMQTRYGGTVVPQIAFGVTITGFVIYVIGRIFVANKRKKSRSTLTE